MKHLDDFNTFSLNENTTEDIKPVQIRVIGKSKDMNLSRKKANSNVNHVADMLKVQNNYKVIDEKIVKSKDGESYLTKIDILIDMSAQKLQALENSISKFDNAPFSIVKKES
jgi:hypothetical protein